MLLKYFILPISIIILSSVIIGIALNLEEAAQIIVGDGLQPRVFPIFLMTLKFTIMILKHISMIIKQFRKYLCL